MPININPENCCNYYFPSLDYSILDDKQLRIRKLTFANDRKYSSFEEAYKIVTEHQIIDDHIIYTSEPKFN
jgi:hypothetical protein